MKIEIIIRTEKAKIDFKELEKTEKEAFRLADKTRGSVIDAKALTDGTKVILKNSIQKNRV